jgi:hypothetical protein
MRRRLIALVPLVALVACGSDDAAGPSSESTLPGVEPGRSGDVVVHYAEVGGFVPREFAFQQTPNLLITGDGLAFTPGARIEIYPGPLLPAIEVRTITPGGIGSILAAADEDGLLADVEYEAPTNIADASTAQLALTADGETWVHEAYALALGGDDESDPQRRALLDFLTRLGDLPALAGPENLGVAELWSPESFQIEALVVDLAAFGDGDILPTVVPWPADARVRLAAATTCVEVPAEEVAEVLGAANQLTFFADADVTYQVLARPALPGRACA